MKDRKYRLIIPLKFFFVSKETAENLFNENFKVSLSDYLLRTFSSTINTFFSTTEKIPILVPFLDQYILKRNYISILNNTVVLDIKLLRQRNKVIASDFLNSTLPLFINEFIKNSQLNTSEFETYWKNIEDQTVLREMVSCRGICFVANGSILPRIGTCILI